MYIYVYSSLGRYVKTDSLIICGTSAFDIYCGWSDVRTSTRGGAATRRRQCASRTVSCRHGRPDLPPPAATD